jgi:hypothetical protein
MHFTRKLNIKLLVNSVLSVFNYQVNKVNSAQILQYPIEATESEKEIIEITSIYTMTGRTRQWHLISAINYINNAKIKGDIVECGVWKGGNLILAELLNRASGTQRRIVGFDTFDGMNSPGDEDFDFSGNSALNLMKNQPRDSEIDNIHCLVEKARVVDNLHKCLGINEIQLIQGEVEKTLLEEDNLPKEIAILRLDTDWYESTRIELQVLYPRLSIGGVLIIDDYGSFAGAKKAVDEYFPLKNFLFFAGDHESRMMIKLQ